MKIEVKLFATFRDHLPPGSDSFSCHMEVGPGTTVQDVLKEFDLPEDIPKIILVNGIHAKPHDALRERDVLSVFPPVAGG
jgi:molybdopterin synthase sulfur carrier subunit